MAVFIGRLSCHAQKHILIKDNLAPCVMHNEHQHSSLIELCHSFFTLPCNRDAAPEHITYPQYNADFVQFQSTDELASKAEISARLRG